MYKLITSIIEELKRAHSNDFELGSAARLLDFSAIVPGGQHYVRTDFTPEKITQMEDGGIFVFASNSMGHHWGGSARTAYEKFGAVWGNGYGIQGRSYAIATLTKPSSDPASVKKSLGDIYMQLQQLYDYARKNAGNTFYVTKIGTGSAGFAMEDMARLFHSSGAVPSNVVLPMEFVYDKGIKL